MKYIVKKPFVDDTGKLWTLDQITDRSTFNAKMPKSLEEYGFIEPYEEKPKRWRAEQHQSFYFVDIFSEDMLVDLIEYDNEGEVSEHLADARHELGNYFKSKETATAVAETLRLFFEWLHTPLEVTASKESTHWADMYDAMNKARELVMADNEAQS